MPASLLSQRLLGRFRVRGVWRFNVPLDDDVRVGLARAVAGHGGEEVASLQRIKPEIRARSDRCRVRHAAQQRGFAKRFARPQPCDQASVTDDLCLATGDHVKAVTAITLREHGVARSDAGRLELAREVLQRGHGQRLKQKHCA